MILLDGKKVSEAIKAELSEKLRALTDLGAPAPCLAAILTGDNPASKTYVSSKIRSCEQVGFQSRLIELPETVSEEDLLREVRALNADPEVTGYIVQLPLPRHIDETRTTLAIDPTKDVDGFHPVNFGRMALGLPALLPATPYGIIELLRRYEVPTSGKHCVVIGRSNIVGRPISILLSQKGFDCTVTVTHSRTHNLQAEVSRADIVIAAIGIPQFVKADWIKEGAVVIDVGINRIADETRKSGFRIVGDVDFEQVAPKCSFITPVPGGVGLMTVAMLMMNTWIAARERLSDKFEVNR